MRSKRRRRCGISRGLVKGVRRCCAARPLARAAVSAIRCRRRVAERVQHRGDVGHRGPRRALEQRGEDARTDLAAEGVRAHQRICRFTNPPSVNMRANIGESAMLLVLPALLSCKGRATRMLCAHTLSLCCAPHLTAGACANKRQGESRLVPKKRLALHLPGISQTCPAKGTVAKRIMPICQGHHRPAVVGRDGSRVDTGLRALRGAEMAVQAAVVARGRCVHAVMYADIAHA
eukprot:2119947-Pleurochrysis_carterae.AAC.2